ncbi:MAG TPA: hypothetical protein VGL65_00115, partial [Gemmatimonadales bacterium]
RALKLSVPGASAIDARFVGVPTDWDARLRALPGVSVVQPLGGETWRVVAEEAGRVATALVGMARDAGVQLQALTVSSTTLDDVFAHYTGHAFGEHGASEAGAGAAPRAAR